MADLFKKQAKQYSENRPSYPAELFRYLASTTPSHDLAWDIATGSGQAALSLAGYYDEVVATDTSGQQLQYAAKHPKIRYHQTPPLPTLSYLGQHVVGEGTVDLVTVAQALHWFDLPLFFEQVKWALKKPGGVIAVWGYTLPELGGAVGSMLDRFYKVESRPYWDQARRMVDLRYADIHFPFEELEEEEEGPVVELFAEREMGVEGLLDYFRSWSAYQTAKTQGVELLPHSAVAQWRRAWEDDGGGNKLVRFPIFLRLGRV